MPADLRNQLGGMYRTVGESFTAFTHTDPANRGKSGGGRNGQVNRKDRRKAEREQKKSQRAQPRSAPPPPATHVQNGKRKAPVQQQDEDSEVDWEESEDEPAPVKKTAAPKSILKKKAQPDEDDAPAPAKVSRAVQDRLDEDDREIRALEKKLGKRKKSAGGGDDGLDDLFGDLGDFSDDDALENPASKRKRAEDDDWLASKRRKALGTAAPPAPESDEEDEEDELENPFSEDDDLDSEDMDDDVDKDLDDGDHDDDLDDEMEDEEGSIENPFSEDEMSEDEEDEEPAPRVRENPYVAPVAANAAPTTKYIPPALRGPPSSDAEALSRLKRQIQGLINRLSEANILTILKDIEKIYATNPRGYVNTTLIDLLIDMLSDPSALLESFIILHAGFIAAVYKVIGPDFGAQIVERIVAEFDKHYQPNKDGAGKQTTNLMSVVSELYTFQVIGSNIVFDYIRFFLNELSEINTELLLRIVRAAGPQLRQDDPTALKDIVVLLQKSVASVGQQNLPVRTKFMIETISDLKNNKMKTGIAGASITRERTTQMKKQLGTLNSRNLKATEPLRVGLKDIRDTDKVGKWWLVGASWRNQVQNDMSIEEEKEQPRKRVEEEDEGGEVDLVQLAREQRMNTDVRRAIYVSIMSASDFKDAQIRLNKLNLKKAQEVEIPKVIIHCAGAEKTYNPYYTILARKVCSDHKTRKSFQFALWDIFKSLGENQDGGADSDEEVDDSKDVSLRKLVNQGKLYGTLIAKRVLSITCLKNLNFPYLQAKTKTFVEIMLVTVILETQKGAKGEKKETALLQTFVEVDQAPEMVAGLQFFLKKVVSKTDIVEQSEKETVKWGCKAVISVLNRILATTTLEED